MKKLSEEQQHLTCVQLASRWNISLRTLEHWRRDGKGPEYIKLGFGVTTKILYKRSVVEKFEAKSTVKTNRRRPHGKQGTSLPRMR